MLRHLVSSSSLGVVTGVRVCHAAAAVTASVPSTPAPHSHSHTAAASPSLTHRRRLHALPLMRTAAAATPTVTAAHPSSTIPTTAATAAAATSVTPSAASGHDGHAHSNSSSGGDGYGSHGDSSHADGNRGGHAGGTGGHDSGGPEQPYVDPTHTWLDRLLSNSAVRKRVLACATVGVGLELSEQVAAELPSIVAWQMALTALCEPHGLGLAQARYATVGALWNSWKREQRLMLARQEEARARSPPSSSWWSWLSDGAPEGWDPARRPLVFDAAQMELERSPSLRHLDLLERADALRHRPDVQRAAVWEVLLRMSALEQIRKKWGQRKVAEMEQRQRAEQQELQRLMDQQQEEEQSMQTQQ